jgi:hypothetical protein
VLKTVADLKIKTEIVLLVCALFLTDLDRLQYETAHPELNWKAIEGKANALYQEDQHVSPTDGNFYESWTGVYGR